MIADFVVCRHTMFGVHWYRSCYKYLCTLRISVAKQKLIDSSIVLSQFTVPAKSILSSICQSMFHTCDRILIVGLQSNVLVNFSHTFVHFNLLLRKYRLYGNLILIFVQGNGTCDHTLIKTCKWRWSQFRYVRPWEVHCYHCRSHFGQTLLDYH